MVNWLRLFQKISERIRREIKPVFGSEMGRNIVGKGAGGDMTRYMDILAEKIVINTLEAEDVSCTLISEECGVRKIGKDTGGYVVLDSIDGTTNATRSIPFVSTSIAHATERQLKSVDVALVKDLWQGVEFTAIKRTGAFKDGGPLKTSTINNLGEAILAVDLSFKEKLPELMDRLLPALCRTLKIRSMGSTALEVCYVASGALDAFIDIRGLTRSTDLAAAYLILKEAGGLAVTPTGEELHMPIKADSRTSFASVANENLCSEIIKFLKSHKR